MKALYSKQGPAWWNPEGSYYVTNEPTERESDVWLECQVEAGYITKTELEGKAKGKAEPKGEAA